MNEMNLTVFRGSGFTFRTGYSNSRTRAWLCLTTHRSDLFNLTIHYLYYICCWDGKHLKFSLNKVLSSVHIKFGLLNVFVFWKKRYSHSYILCGFGNGHSDILVKSHSFELRTTRLYIRCISTCMYVVCINRMYEIQ